MLNFFPTPYPGEWWYSILCRYHVRSGNTSVQTTNRELFCGRSTANLGKLFPNQTVQEVVSQVPDQVLTIENALLNHTLFNYYMRFFSLEYKKKAFETLRNGEGLSGTVWSIFSSTNWTLRYCPCCVEEDMQKYGEPYWHREHQIPEMRTCPKHGCRLNETSPEYARRMTQHYFPLSSVSIDMTQTESEVWEKKLSTILCDYLTMPMQIAPPVSGNSNLSRALFNNGMGKLAKNGQIYLEPEKVNVGLREIFPQHWIDGILNEKTERATILRSIRLWKAKKPERYAVLQLMAGIDMDTMFSEVPISFSIVDKLREMERTGRHPAKKEVLETLGICNAALDRIARLEDIAPFWTHVKRIDEPKKTIRLTIPESEYLQIKKAAEEAGYCFVADFVASTLRKSTFKTKNNCKTLE